MNQKKQLNTKMDMIKFNNNKIFMGNIKRKK